LSVLILVVTLSILFPFSILSALRAWLATRLPIEGAHHRRGAAPDHG
jgi:hypothetical protein